MPLVPAAGYQTESFPQTRAPDRPPEDYQNIRATPEMFGAQVGAQQERFGAIAERGSTELADRAVQIQLLNNQIIADKSQSDYTQRSNKMLYGDPSDGTVGLFAKHGAEAQEAARQIGPQLDALRDNMAAQLPNARARLEFNEYTRRQRMFQDRDIFSHYERETQAYGAEVQKAAVVGAIQHAGLNYSNPEQIAFSDEKADQASVRQAQNLGLKLTDEATANLVHLGRDHITQAVVDGYLSHNDPVGAQNFLKDRQIYDPKISETLNKTVHRQFIGADVKGFLFGGDKPTPNLTPYSPGPQTLSETGMSSDQYDKYRHFLAAHESSSYNEPPNKEGYMGRYQMGATEIKEAANRLGVPVPTQSEFLSNPELQEKLFENYTANNNRQLMANPIYASATPEMRASILAGAHLGGVGGVNKYLAGGGDPADRLGTHVSTYVNGMSMAMGGQGPTQAFDLGNVIKEVRARYPDPVDFAEGMQSVEGMMRMINMQSAAETKAQNEADEKTAGGFMKRILKGEVVPEAEIAGAIGPNGLKPRTAENLAAVAQGHLADQAASIPIKMGPGYWDVQKRIMLPAGDPNRISDVGDILALARPENGNWLTATGADKLIALATSKKTEQGASDAALQDDLFKAVHAQLSGHVPGFTHDTMGESQFLKFASAYWASIDDLKKTMSMHEIIDLTKGPFAPMMKSTAEGGLKRSMAEMQKDMLPDMNIQDLTGQPAQRLTVGGAAAPSGPRIIEFDAGGNRVTK